HIVGDKGVSNVSFQEADAEDLPFESDQFDLVTCRIAPHHFPDAQRFLRECARVLRPGALLILQDQLLPDDNEAAQFVDAFERLRDPSHNRAFNEAEWTSMCAAA
ncbi:MAG: methyltransferase domain-containing protein, partial [Anaerolineae bacterium]|nr:methyltransferase domain-containing protein [Anaerolineae bacterium]